MFDVINGQKKADKLSARANELASHLTRFTQGLGYTPVELNTACHIVNASFDTNSITSAKNKRELQKVRMRIRVIFSQVEKIYKKNIEAINKKERMI